MMYTGVIPGTRLVNVNQPVAIVSGQQTVTTAGTRVALSSSATALYAGVMVRADVANSGVVYLGGSTVSSSNGYKLAAGDAVFVAISDLSALSIDASANSQSVSFIGS